MSVETVLGVVMAGGASRRMGFDKRELRLGGQSLVERSAAVLRSVCEEVVISIQPDAAWENGELRAIRDRRARCGPLAGLEASLYEAASVVLAGSESRAVFLLACDMPHVGVEVVRYVLDVAAQSSGAAAVVPSLEGRRQPLCALYRVQALAAVRQQLESADRSMAALMGEIAVREVEIGPELRFFRTDLFHNLNRPADLAATVASPGIDAATGATGPRR